MWDAGVLMVLLLRYYKTHDMKTFIYNSEVYQSALGTEQTGVYVTLT